MSKPVIIVIGEGKAAITLKECFSPHYDLKFCQTPDDAFVYLKIHPPRVIYIFHSTPSSDINRTLQSLTRLKPNLPIVVISHDPGNIAFSKMSRNGTLAVLREPINKNELLLSLLEIESGLRKYPQTTDHREGRINKIWQFARAVFMRIYTREKTNRPGTITVSREEYPPSQQFPQESTELPPEKAKAAIIGDNMNIEAHFLGHFVVKVNGVPITCWPGKKGRSLVAYLLSRHKRRVVRDILMDEFWPNSDPECARNCLNVSIHGIRKAFMEITDISDFILYKDECYFLNPRLTIQTDTNILDDLWQKGKQKEQANQIAAAMKYYKAVCDAYSGDFMENDLYEGWIIAERDNLKEIYFHALDRLSNYYSNNSKPATAIVLCKKLLRKDICREDIHRRLMYCYHRMGQRPEAIRQYHRCVSVLKEELEVKPTQLTTELYEQIKKH